MKKEKFNLSISLLVVVAVLIGILQNNALASSSFSQELQKRLENGVVLYIGSPTSFVKNEETLVDILNPEVYPFIKDGRTLVPIRFISEGFGAKVDWDNLTSTVSVTLNGKIVKLTIGSNAIIVDNKMSTIDVPAQIVNERTFIPLRALVEALGKKVFWDDRGLIIISDNEKVIDPVSDSELLTEIIDKFNYKMPRGNSVGNSNVGGEAAIQGDWIYYRNRSDNNSLYKVKTDGTEKTKVIGTSVDNLNVIGDWIYYRGQNGNIFKVKADGNNLTQINGDNSNCINVVGDWIYYINLSDKEKIYKIKTDGTNRTKLGDDTVNFFINAVGNWIYYRNWDEGYNIYKIKTDGTEKTKVNDDISWNLNVVDDWIYYSNGNDDDYIYKIKTDGTERTMVINTKSQHINVSDGWIYYANWSDEGKLYKVKIDGTNKTKLTDDTAGYINVVGDWVYYFNYSDSSSLAYYRIKNDGTQKEKVN